MMYSANLNGQFIYTLNEIIDKFTCEFHLLFGLFNLDRELIEVAKVDQFGYSESYKYIFIHKKFIIKLFFIDLLFLGIHFTC